LPRCYGSAPLVLHGSSGVPDGDLIAAVRGGMVKVNIGTAMAGTVATAPRLLAAAR
jgi:fructose-bisphosphate aldolase class II